jgi:hypothetical protein
MALSQRGLYAGGLFKIWRSRILWLLLLSNFLFFIILKVLMRFYDVLMIILFIWTALTKCLFLIHMCGNQRIDVVDVTSLAPYFNETNYLLSEILYLKFKPPSQRFICPSIQTYNPTSNLYIAFLPVTNLQSQKNIFLLPLLNINWKCYWLILELSYQLIHLSKWLPYGRRLSDSFYLKFL